MKVYLSRTTNFEDNKIENLTLLQEDIEYFKAKDVFVKGNTRAVEIEVNSIDDILLLYKHYGSLVIEENIWDRKKLEIEIYDGYRE